MGKSNKRFRRVGISLFSVPLGLAGLGNAWAAARTYFGAPEWPGDILLDIAGIVWFILTVAYLFQNRVSGGLRTEARHPTTGPLVAFIPVVAILLAVHFDVYLAGAACGSCGQVSRSSHWWPPS